MKNILLLSVLLLICSCGGSSEISIIGTWDFSRPSRTDPFENAFKNSGEESKAEKIRKKYDAEGFEHFYLVFDEKGILTEYKAGFAMQFDYRIANDTIFTGLDPYYQILKLTTDELTLKKIQRGNITTYRRVEVDLSDHEMAN